MYVFENLWINMDTKFIKKYFLFKKIDTKYFFKLNTILAMVFRKKY